ncbi:uncharacterized protein BO87DRAFT_207311 [Aspergillus neoniger CBS 115656]|uniref:Uncharacterized protein n=1 Tax=Aspergillus neoniger (strain CBS 115656) TaxID=1448310 RepID=A0A318ZAY1_ASPNB|nr:hypothetical protein BO87DRAFT_207311 [Aspergillus neoniger CBS 115656]PYH37448.1 hypothetical protein BO87DRAFT_207311 [Aspergillus neoniger CBS 115656]
MPRTRHRRRIGGYNIRFASEKSRDQGRGWGIAHSFRVVSIDPAQMLCCVRGQQIADCAAHQHFQPPWWEALWNRPNRRSTGVHVQASQLTTRKANPHLLTFNAGSYHIACNSDKWRVGGLRDAREATTAKSLVGKHLLTPHSCLANVGCFAPLDSPA